MNHKIQDFLWAIGKYGSLLIGSLIVLFPIWIALINSLKSNQDFNNLGLLQLPRHLDFANYITAWNAGGLGAAFVNTLFIIVLSVIGNITFGTMVAYVLGRFEFRFKKIIMAAYLIVMFIPTITTQVATFGVIQGLGLFDTPFALVLIYLGTDVVQIYIYLQFINRIPISLDESAMLDGASYFRIYRSIIFPLLLPASATVAILKVIAIYGDLYNPYLYMPSANLGVVSTALMRFEGPYSAEWNLILAASIIIAIPMVILYLFLQRFIFAGIINGAVKE